MAAVIFNVPRFFDRSDMLSRMILITYTGPNGTILQHEERNRITISEDFITGTQTPLVTVTHGKLGDPTLDVSTMEDWTTSTVYSLENLTEEYEVTSSKTYLTSSSHLDMRNFSIMVVAVPFKKNCRKTLKAATKGLMYHSEPVTAPLQAHSSPPTVKPHLRQRNKEHGYANLSQKRWSQPWQYLTER